MILDATAGNRTMWKHKNSENIIYIDIEKELEVKPTIYCDNTQTPFRDKTFDTIFFDPPHFVFHGKAIFVTKNVKQMQELYPEYVSIPRYYGLDKYKTKTQLIKHLYNASRELYRILKDDGLLWLKWNDIQIPLNKVLGIFNEWTVLLILNVTQKTKSSKGTNTYWICMEKKIKKTKQTILF